MNTVKVNLLPPEILERARERRRIALTAGALTLFIAGLGTIYWFELGDVQRAREERDAAQTQVTTLQSQVQTLDEYRVLRDLLDSRNAMLASAMSEEVGVAGVLNDLPLAFPSSASLRSLSLTLQSADADEGETAAGAGQPEEADGDVVIGSLTFEGYTTERYEPGVAGVIVDFDGVADLVRPFVATAQEELIGETAVTSFSGKAELNSSAYTGRYRDGLPDQEN